jgi:hypothetical protein
MAELSNEHPAASRLRMTTMPLFYRRFCETGIAPFAARPHIFDNGVVG